MKKSPYDAIVFVPAGEGKKIDGNDQVEVSPTTVKREEHGFIRGRVVAVSELPATKLSHGVGPSAPGAGGVVSQTVRAGGLAASSREARRRDGIGARVRAKSR